MRHFNEKVWFKVCEKGSGLQKNWTLLESHSIKTQLPRAFEIWDSTPLITNLKNKHYDTRFSIFTKLEYSAV